ncbi:MAG: ATP-dependent DNA helicase RecQ [Candidatus Omnitrophota bacterium]|jgi:ATP-dependent DNA helicase RecQ
MDIKTKSTPIEVLKQCFGYESFRLDQEAIINSVLLGQDAFVLMPTGGGKSLCYQIPAIIMDGLTIVISPLIALMKDQVDALTQNGINAAYLNSSLTIDEQRELIQNLESGQIKLLYIAPEKLFAHNGQFMEYLKSSRIPKIALFAIDEAHCISQWGHDFRPEYLKLSVLKNEFEHTPILALTATAEALTLNDIYEKLGFTKANSYISSFDRPNIHYHVEAKTNTYARLLEYLKLHKGESGIVYTMTRRSVEDTARQLEQDGYSAKPYHAGLSREDRETNQEAFIRDQADIIVATVAFGMGIDKSNIRFVIHLDMPKNIESYYQETGRAGRDGLKSEALLFYSPGDMMRMRALIDNPENPEQNDVLMHKLSQMNQFCNSHTCRRQFLLQYFGDAHSGNCASCDICLNESVQVDGSEAAKQIIQAVYALKQYYGLTMVIDFLRGSKSKKIQSWHSSLPGFGEGSAYSKDDWRIMIYSLVAQGFLKQEGQPYPVLKLTASSQSVVEGEESVYFKNVIKKTIVKTESNDCDQELLRILKATRMEIANNENVPAYIIFSDKSLIELASYRPFEMEELGLISGFSEIKVTRYGKIFLEEIKKYCYQYDIDSCMHKKTKPQRSEPKKQSNEPSPTQLETLALFKKGHKFSEIAALRGLVKTTVEGHLAAFVLSGDLEVQALARADKIDIIKEAILRVGQDRLAPIRYDLNNTVEYVEIKAVLNDMKRQGQI